MIALGRAISLGGGCGIWLESTVGRLGGPQGLLAWTRRSRVNSDVISGRVYGRLREMRELGKFCSQPRVYMLAGRLLHSEER